MKDKIQDKLDEIEQIYGVKIVYAAEAGSRAWGFASQDSDWDVRFIYTRPPSWYLCVRERRDVIEPPVDGLLDINGWDLKKALFHLGKSNPPLVEWLKSPIVYKSSNIAEKMAKMAVHHFNPRSSIYHYLHMAIGNYRTYLKNDLVPLKKYLYVVRPIACCLYIENNHKMPPVNFMETMDMLDDRVPSVILDIMGQKMAGKELGMVPRIDHLNQWIEEKIQHLSEAKRMEPKPLVAMDDLDEFFMEAVLVK